MRTDLRLGLLVAALATGPGCDDSNSAASSNPNSAASSTISTTGGTTTTASSAASTATTGAQSSSSGGAASSSTQTPTSSATDGSSAGGAPEDSSADAATSSSGSSTTGGGATGGTGGTGGTGSAEGPCSASGLFVCEDFEGTPLGEVPEGWTRHGDEIAVADDETHTGQRALRMGAIPVWERRIYTDASGFGSAHWGRIYYKVALPVPEAFVHSTLVALSGEGPTRGSAEFRVIDTVKQAVDTPDVGSLHQYLYNVQPEDSGEFAREGPYDQEFDGEWHCVEYHIAADDQSYALYIDGEEELSFSDGAGQYDDSDIPESFAELRVGWINYQESPPGFTAWIDDIAFGPERIGCLE